MFKLLLIFFLAFIALAEAKMVDGIAMIVEGEPVTTAEIRAVRTQMGISKNKAIDLLIQDRLQKTAMKDIAVTEEEIDNKIAEIAKLNKLSIPKMQKILKQQGTSWVAYRNSIRDAIKKQHFYQEVIASTIPEPSEDTLKLFYNDHKKSFILPATIRAVEYSAPTEETLKKLVAHHKTSGVNSKTIRKQTDKLTPELLSLYLQTPKGKFTKILNAGDKYIVYKILSKSGKRIMPFDLAKPAVTAAWKQEQQGETLKDYFKKLRTQADIQILR